MRLMKGWRGVTLEVRSVRLDMWFEGVGGWV